MGDPHRPPPPVAQAWFDQPTLELAQRLLGMHLVHDAVDGLSICRIVEVEAYRGPEDQAAHSANGRRTRRTEIMFGEAGRAYVYQIYGLHHCLNVVSGGVGCPEAVLLRAGEPLVGRDAMRRRRRLEGAAGNTPRITAGPARLVEALGVTRLHYGHPLWEAPLYLAAGAPVEADAIASGPRIGVGYAGEWALCPWRFWIRESRYVSRPSG